MSKRLLVGLFAVCLAAIWTFEAHALVSKRQRRSVVVSVYGDNPNDQNVRFVTNVFGLPDDCQVKGRLYCAQSSEPADILKCQQGLSAARVVVIDRDAIGKGAQYLDASGTTFTFSAGDVNWQHKGLGQREQLPFFENATIAAAEDSSAGKITLSAGSRKDPAFFALTDIPDSWSKNGQLTPDAALRRYVGTWDDERKQYVVDEGFGRGAPPQKYLKKGVDIEPVSEFKNGELICGVVHHNEIKGNVLLGNYLGLVAFRVLGPYGGDEKEGWWNVEVLDADEVCRLPLYNAGFELVDGGENGCLELDAEVPPETLVFAPAFAEGELRAGEGKFVAAEGILDDCSGPSCKGSAKVELDPYSGQALCEEYFPENENVTFVSFAPINRGEGDYPDDAFIGHTEFRGPLGDIIATETVKCRDPEDGSLQYDCAPPGTEIVPTCSEDCGPNLPDNLTAGGNYADFLDLVGIGRENCTQINSDNFVKEVVGDEVVKEVWDFKAVGMEAGNTLFTIRDNGVITKIFDSDDCASMGIVRRVDFNRENLIFVDTKANAEVSLDPYTVNPAFPISGKGPDGAVQIDTYMCQYSGAEVVLNPDHPYYLKDPLTVKNGQYFIFFNDYDTSADYDDFVLIGTPVSVP